MAMITKYSSRCRVCGEVVLAGSRVEWDRATRKVAHLACAEDERAPAPGVVRFTGESAFGCRGWTVGQVILPDQRAREAGRNTGLVVLSVAEATVLSAAGASNAGVRYEALARPATPEEMAPAIEAEHETANRMERTFEVGRLAALAREKGELGEVGPLQGDLIGIELQSSWELRAVIEPKVAIWWMEGPVSPTPAGKTQARRLDWSENLERRVRRVQEAPQRRKRWNARET